MQDSKNLKLEPEWSLLCFCKIKNVYPVHKIDFYIQPLSLVYKYLCEVINKKLHKGVVVECNHLN